MPSPRKPTTWPSRFNASNIRSFCCGLMRQNKLTRDNCPISASSERCVSASPVSTPVTGTPISAKTWRVTSSLSPVSTFTEMPAAAIAWIVAPALAFGGSRNTAKPEKTRSHSSVIAAVSWLISTVRLAMPRARNPCAPSASRVASKTRRVSASSGCSFPSASSYRPDSRSRSSGAPFTIRRRLAVVLDQNRDAPPLEIERNLVDLPPSSHVEWMGSEDRLVERALHAAFELAVDVGIGVGALRFPRRARRSCEPV